MSAITFDNINIAYGDFRVVRDLNLAIEDKEFIVLVGPSGCGKSTILRLIAGLEDVHSGSLSIGDRVVNAVAPKDRDVAMVFQNYALYPHMTVRENIAFGMKIRKEEKAKIKAQIDEVVDIVNLRDQLNKKPGALSGGQRQRVALARAIVRHPGVFLFDEPLSNLDAEFRTSMRQEISRLHKKLQATMVYVTHDQVEAMTMGDKIAVLAPIHVGGNTNLMQFGTPEELYDNPQNLFVAKFIGSPPMNLFTISSPDHPILRSDETSFLRNLIKQGRNIVLGIRPEHLVWGENAGMPTLDCTISAIEKLGHEQIVFVQSEIGDITLRLPDFHGALKVGESCQCSIPLSRSHVFDAATERRLEVNLS